MSKSHQHHWRIISVGLDSRNSARLRETLIWLPIIMIIGMHILAGVI
jgi:hypothetical protein